MDMTQKPSCSGSILHPRGQKSTTGAEQSQTINKESRNWQLHHDNAPAHSSHLIQSFLARHGIPVVHQARYSPDMAPCDFWLFPKLKRPLKGSRFDSRKDIMWNAMKELRSFLEMLPAVEGTMG
jgi:transposase